MRSVMRTVLVIGNCHEELIQQYNLEHPVEKYMLYPFDMAQSLHNHHVALIKDILDSKVLKLTEVQLERYGKLYQVLTDMSDAEYFDYLTEGCEYDENHNAYTTSNPQAFYRSPKCYQDRLIKEGTEAEFSNPFKLKDGNKSYSARFNDIDWSKNHLYGRNVYEAVWELCVEGREPKTDYETKLRDSMINRSSYFANFDSKEDYVLHSCSFWTYGVIDRFGEYHELNYNISDKEWVKNFYDTFISTIEGNPLLTIYEVRSLND